MDQTPPPATVVSPHNLGAAYVYGPQNNYYAAAADLSIADNIPPLKQRLVRRETEVEELIRAFQSGERAGLSGVVAQGEGGQGKSTLALLYASDESSRKVYTRGRIFAKCSGRTPEDVFADLAPATLVGEFTFEERAKITKEILSREPGYLLILDNIDDPQHWVLFEDSGLLPGSHCHLLVTCRQNLPSLHDIRVDRLTPGECRDLLAQYRPTAADRANRPAMDAIVRETEGLAVLVAAVGAAMLNDEDDDWGRYADWLHSAPTDQLPDVESVHRYPVRAGAILDDLFGRLRPAEARVIEFAAVLPVDRIAPGWLEQMLQASFEDDEEKLDLGTNSRGEPLEPTQVVERLLRLGILTLSSSTDRSAGDALAPQSAENTLSIHRLLAKRTRERLVRSPQDLNRLAGRVFVLVNDEHQRAMQSFEQVALHRALAESTSAVELLSRLREILEPAGQWSASLQNDLATVYMNRGVAHRASQDLAASIRDYDASIAIREGLRSSLEPAGQWSASLRNDLANAYMNRGVAHWASQDLAASIRDYDASIAVGEQLRAGLEAMGRWSAGLRTDLARAYSNRAITHKRAIMYLTHTNPVVSG